QRNLYAANSAIIHCKRHCLENWSDLSKQKLNRAVMRPNPEQRSTPRRIHSRSLPKDRGTINRSRLISSTSTKVILGPDLRARLFSPNRGNRVSLSHPRPSCAPISQKITPPVFTAFF